MFRFKRVLQVSRAVAEVSHGQPPMYLWSEWVQTKKRESIVIVSLLFYQVGREQLKLNEMAKKNVLEVSSWYLQRGSAKSMQSELYRGPRLNGAPEPARGRRFSELKMKV